MATKKKTTTKKAQPKAVDVDKVRDHIQERMDVSRSDVIKKSATDYQKSLGE